MYLFGKNGKLAEADATIAAMHSGQRESAEAKVFLDWFTRKFLAPGEVVAAEIGNR